MLFVVLVIRTRSLTKSTTWIPNLNSKRFSDKKYRWSDNFAKKVQKPVFTSDKLLSSKFGIDMSDLVTGYMLDLLKPVYKSLIVTLPFSVIVCNKKLISRGFLGIYNPIDFELRFTVHRVLN